MGSVKLRRTSRAFTPKLSLSEEFKACVANIVTRRGSFFLDLTIPTQP
jgi:hypothetical protein